MAWFAIEMENRTRRSRSLAIEPHGQVVLLPPEDRVEIFFEVGDADEEDVAELIFYDWARETSVGTMWPCWDLMVIQNAWDILANVAQSPPSKEPPQLKSGYFQFEFRLGADTPLTVFLNGLPATFSKDENERLLVSYTARPTCLCFQDHSDTEFSLDVVSGDGEVRIVNKPQPPEEPLPLGPWTFYSPYTRIDYLDGKIIHEEHLDDEEKE